MKITKEMMAEEYGFIEGEVIQIKAGEMTYDGLVEIGWFEPVFFEKINNDLYDSEGEYDDPEMIQIRVLTGPMSIWNHAPKDADICHIKINGSIDWLRGTIDGWKYQLGNVTLIERPWWAK